MGRLGPVREGPRHPSAAFAPRCHAVLEAQAEQRRKARIILMDAEQDVAAVAEEVGEAYGGGDAALRLRAMHLLYESVRETGGTVVVPSSFSEGFGDVLPEGVRYPG